MSMEWSRMGRIWKGGNRRASSGAEDKDRSLPGLGWEYGSWNPEDRSGVSQRGGWKTWAVREYQTATLPLILSATGRIEDP